MIYCNFSFHFLPNLLACLASLLMLGISPNLTASRLNQPGPIIVYVRGLFYIRYTGTVLAQCFLMGLVPILHLDVLWLKLLIVITSTKADVTGGHFVQYRAF